ncbi:hypothetical protein, partial [Pseudomonas sp. BF-RE-01]|uniref:hypothetical protein n=1 Tax=Pseudomonas sp. BF-RE-01 TaxID=2832361 RepID=UPI001CBCD9F3
LAREGVGSININVECKDAFASKLRSYRDLWWSGFIVSGLVWSLWLRYQRIGCTHPPVRKCL